MSEAKAFEAALAENPDDLSTYSAYADWLQEHDDPRGEFIAVQLALEDGANSSDARDTLKKREAELLAEHERDWLGILAPHLLDRVDPNGRPRPPVEHWWARGFLSEMRVQHFTVPLAQAVADAHATRFLRTLHVETALRYQQRPTTDLVAPTRVPTPQGLSQHEPYFELIGSPCLRVLRAFRFGEDEGPHIDPWTGMVPYVPGLEHLVAGMPRIEELQLLCNGYDARALFALPNLTRLQVLRLFGWAPAPADGVIPLEVLARNPAFGALTHLLVHPAFTYERAFLPLDCVRELVNSPHLKSLSHLQLRLSDMGDEGAQAIIGSGILKQLGWLDLRNGTITDAGALAFAQCAATRSLRRLDLSRNAVTSIGDGQLRRAGVNAVVDNSPSRREIEEEERLEREGDME